MPFFSIVTATRNAAAALPQMLDSLARQSCRDFELIIQDGASKDNTIALAESYRSRLPHLVLNSEPDRGIYDAWNKALPHINGQWVLFLGADDQLADAEVLNRARSQMLFLPERVRYVAGDMVRLWPDAGIRQQVEAEVDQVRKRLRRETPSPQSSLFYCQRLFINNNFDDGLSIVGDYDFVCRTWLDDSQGYKLGFTVTGMTWGGISSAPHKALRARWEFMKVANRYFGGIWTGERCRELSKGICLWFICLLFGPNKAPAILDKIRAWRGLPPHWTPSPPCE
ncbi:MAG: glycosyltransferase [Desulfarculales bacterium]|jgi:glycosyltransferase involved in cell wall biosynthesis|nr:glycosyltransferase [Desulfarculales bacterium]